MKQKEKWHGQPPAETLQRNQLNRPGTGTLDFPPPSRVLSAHLRGFAIGRSYRDPPNQIWDRIESAV